MGRKKIYVGVSKSEIIARTVQLNTIRLRAEKNGIPFSLRHGQLEWPTHCPILGIELFRGGNRDNSPSIDRVIPELGYIQGNVRVISTLANRMKNSASQEVILAFCENIIPYMKGER